MVSQISVLQSSVFTAKDVQFFSDHKGRETRCSKFRLFVEDLTFARLQASADTSCSWPDEAGLLQGAVHQVRV